MSDAPLDDAIVALRAMNDSEPLAALVQSPALAEWVRTSLRIGKPTRDQTMIRARASAKFYADVLKANSDDHDEISVLVACIAELHLGGKNHKSAGRARTGQISKPTLKEGDEVFALICETPKRRDAHAARLKATYQRFKAAQPARGETNIKKACPAPSRFINAADRRAGR